jgi:hypothetical protein
MEEFNMIRAFVNEPADLEKLKDSNIMIAYNSAKEGNLKPLKAMYHKGYSFGSEYLIKGYYKLLGWQFDLSEFCKDYLVKVKYHGWIEYKAPNKTCLYNIIGRHNVLDIIER